MQTMFYGHFSRSRRKPTTHKHVLRRQMTEIGNLTSWHQMNLISEKIYAPPPPGAEGRDRIKPSMAQANTTE